MTIVKDKRKKKFCTLLPKTSSPEIYVAVKDVNFPTDEFSNSGKLP